MVDKKEAKKETTVETTVTTEAENVETSEKTDDALKIVNKYTLASAGAGLIPVPMLDLGVLAGLQFKMIHRLTKHYEQEFKPNIVRATISSLAGMTAATSLRASGLTGLIKAIPIVGFLGSYSMSIYCSALTYAIGKLFVKHYDGGGSLLTLDTDKMKGSFTKYFKEGEKKAAKEKELEPATA